MGRQWVKYAAFGGLICLFLLAVGTAIHLAYQEEHANARQRAAQNDVSTPKPSVVYVCENVGRRRTQCVAQLPDAEAADEHTKADLKAQQDVAEWSLLTAMLTSVGIVLSALAVAFTGWAALAAAKAARAAELAVDLAREISADESRAYLNVTSANLYWTDYTASNPYIMLSVTNSGQTPAKWFEIRSTTFTTEHFADEKARIVVFADVDLSVPTKRRASGIPGNGGKLNLGCTDQADRKVLAEAFKKSIVVNVAGIIKYETIFGEILETEFWFHGEDATFYDTVPAPPNPTGMARYVSMPEQPQILSMANGDFSTYQIVEKPNE